ANAWYACPGRWPRWRGPPPAFPGVQRDLRLMRLRLALGWVALAAAFFAGGHLGLALREHPGVPSPVGPPTGIALAALTRVGWRLWPGVALGAFLVALDTGSLMTGTLAAAASTTEALVGATLLRRRFGVHLALDRVRDVFGLVLAAPLSSALGAGLGVAGCS